MELENKEWKEFSLTEIFPKIQRGKRLKKADHITGVIPYVSSTALNNGIDGFIGNTKGVRVFQDCLTIANSGSVGSTFYQPSKVVASDHVTKLENKKFNKYIYLFLATMVSRLHEKYSFNREINDFRIRKEKILLPINENGNPDYAFMENYMRKKETELLNKYQSYISSKIKRLKEQTDKKLEWKEFFIGEIFNIQSTSSGIDKIRLINLDGEIPYITRTDRANGIDTFIGNQENKYKTDSNNVITIGLDTQTVFYQKSSFYTGQNIQVLKFPQLNEYNAFFIIPLLKKQMEKFNWGGNGATLTRLRRTKILLPINTKGNPDFEYMENYIKRIEQEKLLKYINHKQLNIS